ncbi:MAG: hypothetical protein ACKVY0_00595 [Prosthecobacter sp.]|uniref:hypothetical protein n=1 Tax=Prosthecobacter sp. TaxID=1965333 RepID=UPI0038FF1D12
MTTLEHRLLSLLQAVRETHDGSARATLNDLLRTDPAARAAMARLLVDEQVLISRLRDDSIVSLLDPAPMSLVKVARTPRWFTWRPLTAAAAGIVFGMFCTSMVFGYVSQRATVKKVPLVVFDQGLESVEAVFDKGLPHQPGQWGVDSARLVTAENGVQPKEGQRMLRLEPIPREKNVKNLASRVYQVLDLRALPTDANNGSAEVQVTASFFATKSEISSRYLIRAFALNEKPEQATKDFWSKTEDDGVVSMAQRFDTSPGDRGWHSFSLKMPLPHGSQTLIFILGAVPPEDAAMEASVHYLDEVSVTLLTAETTLP